MDVVHIQEYKYERDVCGEKFTGRRRMQSHKSEKHNRNRRLQCMACPKVFRSKKPYREHMEEAHPGIDCKI